MKQKHHRNFLRKTLLVMIYITIRREIESKLHYLIPFEHFNVCCNHAFTTCSLPVIILEYSVISSSKKLVSPIFSAFKN